MRKAEKYINQNKIRNRKILAIVIVILIVILSVFFIISRYKTVKTEEKEQAIMSGQFNSIKDILEYYGCEFIKTQDSSDEDCEIDIYTTFKYDLYDGEESNEKFYNNVIDKIAEFLNYSSFRMIDESREDNIEIKVICDGNKIQTIYINDIEDYFIFMDSQISLSKYKKINTTEISVQSPELANCIQNNWSTDTNFGTRETIFQDYYVYFDEGIKTRKISSKIYNIVFTEKYVNQVVNGFTVGESYDIIKDRLGTPTFKSDDGNIIGYKSDDFYVFFEKDQISIYRNTDESGFEDFFELADKFLDDEYDLLEFMNELTYIWPDYEEYTYSSDTVFLSYPNKGIDIKINYDNMDGIILYNNIGVAQSKVNDYLKHTEFVAQLQVDNVYNAELRRVEKENELSTNCKEYAEQYESEDDRNRGKIYDYYMNLTSSEKVSNVYFISKDSDLPNCELNESIDTYIWINDYCFVYSKSQKGIYYYDLKNQVKGTLKTDEDSEFKIESYKDGILTYDEDEQIQVQY